LAEEETQQQTQESLGEEVGKVTHYFTKLGVGIVELSGSLSVGDKIRIKGATTDFEQNVESMQIEHENVEKAEAGQTIGLKVKEHVREHDKVYKV
jgi:putative protease